MPKSRIDYHKMKSRICKYVGSRMVEDNDKEFPGIILNELLSTKDKKTLTNLLDIKGGLLFINIPEGYETNENYITLDIADEDEEEED